MSNGQQVDFLIAGIPEAAEGSVYTYEAGTTTNKAVYTDAAMTEAAENPFDLDSNGRATVYADGNYKFKILDSDNAEIPTSPYDNMYYGIPSTDFQTIRTITTDGTATDSDNIILVDTSADNVELALPTASTIEGKGITIIKVSSDANTLTINPYGAETINGASTATISTQYEGMSVSSDGSNWIKTSVSATSAPAPLRFCIQGTAVTGTDIIGAVMEAARTISSVRMYSDTAPTGASLILDININGTSIWDSTQANRVKVLATENAGTQTSFDTTSLSAGDRVTVDIDQIGSGTAGGDPILLDVIFA